MQTFHQLLQLAVLYPVHTCTLMLVVLSTHSQAVNFVESPSNITQPVGSVAEFRCQHQSLDAIITWLVNGSSASRFPNVTQNNNGNVGTLTIPSVSEYNGIEIVCQAIIRVNGSTVFELTPPAILTVIAVEYVPTTTVEPRTTAMEMTTTMEPVTTTAEPTTTAVPVQSTTETMEPTTTAVTTTSFPTVPSPNVLIVTMEERHVYMCNHSETINIFWRVNGSILNVEIFPIGIDPSTIQLPGGGRVYTLTIGGRLEHNATTIQCLARLSDGSEETTPSVLFLIQGPLRSVVSIERKSTTILWEAPFSLNLTNVEPDIVYCVEVYNITCGRRELLISDCDVMETSYTSDTLEPGYLYKYTVTPRSNVEGAQNGTSKTITEQFTNLLLSTRRHSFSFINITERGDGIEELKTRIYLNNQDQGQIFDIDAVSYSLSLVPLDEFEEESLVIPTYAVKNGSSVLLKASIPYRRLWNYTVLAYDCEEHSLLETNELSTHDVQNISVNSMLFGEVRVTGDFINGSTATGLLVIIYSLTNDSNVHYITGGSTSQQSRSVHVSVPDLAGGEYGISVFVVEENGLPFERVAALPKLVAVETNDVVTPPSSSFEYSLQSTSTSVCITCTFLDSSATHCVAVVHQRISQLNSSGLMNIESSHKLTRSNDTASGCIEGVNMEDYQVGVVGGGTKQMSTMPTRPNSSDKGCASIACYGGIAGGVFVIMILLITVTVIIISLVVKRISKHSSGSTIDQSDGDTQNVELQRCEAYEIVKLSKQKVTMETNPAYAEIGQFGT